MSQYTVYVVPRAWDELRDLPGHIRQRVRRAISALADQPRPEDSQALSLSDVSVEVRRIRLERWRIIYTVAEEDRAVDVVAIRKRPPYDYGDLARLLGDQTQ